MKPVLVISAGTCGLARGAEDLIRVARDYQAQKGLKEQFTIKITGCHGLCESEPNVVVKRDGKKIFYQKLIPESIREIIDKTVLRSEIIERFLVHENGKIFTDIDEVPFYRKQKRLLLGNNVHTDPTVIGDYLELGGYQALKKVLKESQPAEVVALIKAAGLRGRGGAGFPAGKKWELTAQAKSDVKYIICNADEGDPGAYMDRSLLEGNPHLVLEGMIIGAYAIGATEGVIYVRNEYPLAVKNVSIALEQAREKGFLGRNILGSKFSFDIKPVRGAGAFVCGEETALIASIEGQVGRPRSRPPYPAEKGLWGKPTNINNVETWSNIAMIIANGADWFKAIGTAASAGTKIFSLVGKIRNTGLVEVPMGITLREIIYDIGGGIPHDRPFKAVQTGGPSGGCIPREYLDLKIDYDSLTKVGSIMGSGGMIVMDEDTCIVDVAKYFLNFTQQESCGKCPSCRLGTRQMVEILGRITEGRGEDGDIERLEELGRSIQRASLCGLGQTAPNPALSTIKYFRDEYEAHIKFKKCPAAVCKEITYPPCQYACPIDTEASVYIAYAARGQYREAFENIKRDNPLPGVVGRVCHHPCELKCRAGEMDKPIGIRGLKRFVADWARKNKVLYPVKPGVPTGKRVAVIGSGPAGLSVAYYLVLKGHAVTVFEAADKPGGMLNLGIPEYRLPREILQFDIESIMLPGIELRTNTRVGRDIAIDQIISQGYQAVFIAVGAYKSLKLEIPGEEGEDIRYAMEFLNAVHTGKKVSIGKRVAVVGGGNSAVDAARVARRRGSEVTILYRRTHREMPAFKEEVENALLEGITISFLTAPVKILSEGGRLKAIECIKMELGAPDASGRRRPVPIKGSEHVVAADTLIAAISEEPDTEFLKGRVALTKWGAVAVNDETLMTSRQGVFAGGDAIRGPSTVIEAIRDGKTAAESIDKFLSGKPMTRIYRVARPSVWVPPLELSEAERAAQKKIDLPALEPNQRTGNFKEVEMGYDEAMAGQEACRCLRCELETREGREFYQSLREKADDQVED
jgi:NADH-quinone oxidoreductase subunit F